MSIAFNIILSLEEFEDTKGVIRIRKSKDTKQWTNEKGETLIYRAYT